MTSSEGYSAYIEFNAIKLHFNSDYDYFKYHGKTRLTPHSYSKDRYQWVYVKLERMFDNRNSLRQYILSCMLHNQKVWITNIFDNEYKDIHKERINRLSNLDKTLNKFFKKYSTTSKFREYTEVIDGEYPQLVYDLMSGDITFEVYLMFDKQYNFTDYYLKNLDDDFAFPEKAQLLNKYKPFFLKERL